MTLLFRHVEGIPVRVIVTFVWLFAVFNTAADSDRHLDWLCIQGNFVDLMLLSRPEGQTICMGLGMSELAR